MKYALASVAIFAATVVAQANLPTCALTCVSANISSAPGCTITDVACLCKSTAYLQAYATCLASTCSAADAQSATTIGLQLCQQAGVTVNPSGSATASATNSAQSSSAISSASSAASSNASSMSSHASSAASSVSSAASSSAASLSSAASSASSRASSVASSAASSASAAASSATSRAAAPTQAIGWSVMGFGAAAAAALL